MALVGAVMALGACVPVDSEHTGPNASPALQTHQQAIEPGTEEELIEAVELYARTSAEQFTIATDPLERGDTLVPGIFVRGLVDAGEFETLFLFADESFEAERDRVFGAGLGPAPENPAHPSPTARLQLGERGGLDSSSCRSCHFNGGPDGGGTFSQLGLFRSDGQTLGSSTQRDAPHVMGLGYLALVAREIEVELELEIALAHDLAQFTGEPETAFLDAKGIYYGEVTVFPDGSVDAEGLTTISHDFKVRPFGFKGRHGDLVALSDEAFQLHHGMQSMSRTEVFDDRADEYLGDGSNYFDRDDDGIQSESTPGQAVLMASYLSMLGTPSNRPPEDPELVLVWAQGRRLFTEIGCEGCHRSELSFQDYNTHLQSQGTDDLFITIDLGVAGIDPVPRDIDFTPDPEGFIPNGVPFYPFTDLRRHDMGPELAEPVAEVLPEPEGGEVAGNLWMTRPLWGLADTPPYLHDGRAPTVHDAILWHGGESAESRDAYAALDDDEQGALRVFLMSLTREPVMLVE